MKLDKIKNTENVNNVANTSGVSSASSTKAENASIMSKPKAQEELLKKLGITSEEYVKLCNSYKDFAALSVDKQLEIIAKQKTETTPQAETPKTAPTEEVKAEIPATATSTDTEAKETPAATSPTTSEAAAAQTATAQETDYSETVFDGAKFEKLTAKEKMQVYTEEYAKNSFMYADEKNKKTIEQWNALSDEEKAKYLKDAQSALSSEYSELIKGAKDDKIVDWALNYLMTDLRAANRMEMKVNQFNGTEDYHGKKINESQREEYIYDLLFDDNECAPEKMSTLDKIRFQKEQFLAKAVSAKSGQENLCPSDAKKYLKNNNLLEADVEYEYLKNKLEKEGSLTGAEMKILSNLESLQENDAYLDVVNEAKYQGLQNLKKERAQALEAGDTETVKELDKTINKPESKQVEKIASENNTEVKEPPKEYNEFQETVYGKAFQKAKNSEERAAVMTAYIESLPYEQQEEMVLKLSEGLKAQGPEDLSTNMKFLQMIAFKNGKLGDNVLQKLDTPLTNAITVQMIELQGDKNSAVIVPPEKLEIVAKRNADELNNIKDEKKKNSIRKQFSNIQNKIQVLGNDDQKSAVVSGSRKANNDKIIGCNNVNISNSIEDVKKQKEAHIITNSTASEEVKAYGATQAPNSAEQIQVDIIGIYTKGSKKATNAVTQDGTYSKLAVKNQVKAMELTNERIEENFDGQERIDLLKLSSDFIAKSAVENQLEMHKSVMNSKYEDVVAHASSNIHKYDESVQAEAIKSSYATGNQKAIDAVNGQIESCSQKAVAEASKEYNIKQSCAETEARTEKAGSQSYAESVITNNKITQNLTEPEAVKGMSEAEKTSYYIEYFLKTTDTGRYNLLSKLSDSQLKDVISKLCKYNSSMIKGLVAQGLGKYVLQTTGKSPDVLYSTINIMFQKGGKDSKYAADYIMTNKSLIHFSDDMIEKAEEILGKDNIKVNAAHKREESKSVDNENGDIAQYTSNPYGFMKSSLQPRLSSLYPNKKEMFFNA